MSSFSVSLSKCDKNVFLFAVFEEKSLNEAQGFSGEIIVSECNLFANTNLDPNRKILVATRHLRTDSRTIQLEHNRYDALGDPSYGPSFVRPRNKHFRSNSCDIKIGRSNSRESDMNPAYRRFLRGHSRNNSHDIDQEQRMGRALNQQQQPQHYNIRYILNQLKTNNATAEQNLMNLKNNFKNRRHMRNHSYGQEFSFLPNNTIVRLNNEAANQFLQSTCGSSQPISTGHSFRSHSRKNSKDFLQHLPHDLKSNVTKERMLLSKNVSVEMNEELEQKYNTTESTQHSRNNSRDLNKINLASVATSLKSLITTAADEGIRHRRTNSKDLQKAAIAGSEHKRNVSLGKMEAEVATLLSKESTTDPVSSVIDDLPLDPTTRPGGV